MTVKVKVVEPIVAVGLTYTPPTIVPVGQVAAVAYADGDAIGQMFEVPNVVRAGPRSGVLHSAHLLDRSDQGLAVDVFFFRAPFAVSADNAAFTPSDADMLLFYIGALSFATFKNAGANQVSDLTGVGMAFNCFRGVGNGTSIYGQLVARSAPTVTAGGEYALSVSFLQD